VRLDFAGSTDPNVRATLLADMLVVGRCSSEEVEREFERERRRIVAADLEMAAVLHVCSSDRMNAFVRESVFGRGSVCGPSSDVAGGRDR